VRITVKLGAPLSQVVGESKIDLAMAEGATVADVLDELRARHPDFEAPRRVLAVLLERTGRSEEAARLRDEQ